MLKLRQKLLLGFGGLLIVMMIIGLQSILYLTKLGVSVDVILRENYVSVLASQQMKEALERLDSGTLFILLGDTVKGEELIAKNMTDFENALQAEVNNVTLPGEGQKVSQLQKLYARYKDIIGIIKAMREPFPRRRDAYFNDLFPLFGHIKNSADEILQMNQQNMLDANNRARRLAAGAQRQMYIFLFAGIMIAAGFIFFIRRWILRPIQHLTQSAEEIRQGNLDLVIPRGSRDEIGHLSEVFNMMAAGLREFRRSDEAKFIRAQRATQRAFDSLPEAVAVIDLEGKVEIATETAEKIFGLKPGIRLQILPEDWLTGLYKEALWANHPLPPKSPEKPIQRFVQGEERFFFPQAVTIMDDARQPAGVILVFQDITQLRQQNEVKRGVISTVSHQLKTPLTSIRLAIHLLLDEKTGPLTEKQAELLIAAREESDRLQNILSSLLDISRIESGRVPLDCNPVDVQSMIADSLEAYQRTAQDQGVTLVIDLPSDLPKVWVDVNRIMHVFGNLVSNALKHTSPGGKITVSAGIEKEWIRFSVRDSGSGIPGQYLSRVFEPFFRVPEQQAESGAGLGLAIAKEIVEAHGGFIGAESAEGKGSTFFFTLKRADELGKKDDVP